MIPAENIDLPLLTMDIGMAKISRAIFREGWKLDSISNIGNALTVKPGMSISRGRPWPWHRQTIRG
jgi:hypothetical protein